jgi:hypothetical protein
VSDADERTQTYLLRLMLVNDRARSRVRSEGVDGLFAAPLHRALANHLLAIETGGGGLPEQVLDGLEDGDAQALLSGLVIAEGQESWAADPERIFADCRRAVAAGTGRQRLAELQELIRVAEREGNPGAVENYVRELLETKKKL